MSNLYMFLTVALVIIMTPGPDFVLVTKNALANGSRGGRMTAYGIVSSHIIFATASVLGLTAIIAKSMVLFEIIKYAGAVYLFYLGIKALLSKKKENKEENMEVAVRASQKGTKNKTCYFQGIASTLLNPKAIIFYITFLPQFIDLSGNVILQSIILAGIFILIVLAWFLIYVYLLKFIGSWFKKPSVEFVFDKITGIALVSLGAKIALEKINI
ncbi:LysE family translocator [Bacillus subtilis]|uniref:LysE family translocator n=1 Tax=Bacillus subtilis TaxID=1423 RepID=UPI0013670561|nr:LysE family translocator [Bacillus subtilis]QHM13328.1 Leucine efflux protein [Bacillus subtilis]